ncbi:MAG: glycosyltransferase [Coriobacteriia bacterium]|nr:glycosyltransferase [Coriobacteriia bacterium]MCL2749760.1 glycosyltransferase [Coriobacteriia bacterium]
MTSNTTARAQSEYDLSVVIPVFNEAESISSLLAALEDFCNQAQYQIQIVFVDDGSEDDTVALLSEATLSKAAIKLIKLSKNFGAHEAIRAGVFSADADKVVFYSADMPEPVLSIGLFYEKLLEGYELVYSERQGYSGGFGSRTYARLVKRLIRIEYPENGLISVGFGSKIKKELNRNIEDSSSVFFQIFSLGFKRIGIPVAFNERLHGTSKWTLRKKLRHFLDVFVMFSYVPIHAISILGFLLFVIGFIWALIIVITRLVNPEALDPGWPTTISILLLGFGVTNLSLGIIAEYLARTLIATRKRPVFVVDEVIETSPKTKGMSTE